MSIIRFGNLACVRSGAILCAGVLHDAPYSPRGFVHVSDLLDLPGTSRLPDARDCQYERGDLPVIDHTRCRSCMVCIPACPFGAVVREDPQRQKSICPPLTFEVCHAAPDAPACNPLLGHGADCRRAGGGEPVTPPAHRVHLPLVGHSFSIGEPALVISALYYDYVSHRRAGRGISDLQSTLPVLCRWLAGRSLRAVAR